MVSVERAKALLSKNVVLRSSLPVNIVEANGCILGEDIFSPVDLPPFNQSAMDGYAIRLSNKKAFKIIGEIKAGDNLLKHISSGEALSIFTGAAVPSSADCVIMQEKAIAEKNNLILGDYKFKVGENIRLAGSHIKKGTLTLKKGTKLNPASIGLLASLGIVKAKVFNKPEVSLIITGNELRKAGSKLREGQVYESNSATLSAALKVAGIIPKSVWLVRDEKKKLSEKIKIALANSDLVIISGGISVGKYDLVKECLEENSVEEIFYKVAQKPGKPLFAGKAGNNIVFGLPGNPAATLVCFYEYVYPVIRKMMGFKDLHLPSVSMKLLGSDFKKGERALFLKGKVGKNGVLPLEGQESYMMKSFSDADCLIYLPAQREPGLTSKNTEKVFFRVGEMVEVHLL